ncbi:MAG: hypothetical protein E7675_06585, partial [Ruminococcaceae bacterium]|nr:hypothetical protein [Oscillospiraceae bacterium]
MNYENGNFEFREYEGYSPFKKSLSLFLAIVMVVLAIPATVFTAFAGEGVNLGDYEITDSVSIWDGAVDTSWYSEDKSEFELSSAAALAGLARLVNEGVTFEGKVLNLTTDVDWSSKPWTVIGKSEENAFMGTFNGGHNTIVGAELTFGEQNTVACEYVGIFGYIKNARINSLGISECRVNGVNTTLSYIGGLVGYSVDSVVNDCYVSFTDEKNQVNIDHINPLDRDDVLYKKIDDILVETHGGDLSVYENPNGQGLILDLRTGATWIDYSIDIKGDVSAVKVVGDPTKTYKALKFNIGEGDHDVYLEFENMIINDTAIKVDLSTAPEGYVMDRTVYIESSGGNRNVLVSNRGTAIELPNSPVHILGDTELFVFGQDGSDGSSGTTPNDGQDGSPALEAYCLTVTLKNDAVVNFIGGNGGDGGNGADGADATSSGGNGADGVSGANGGSGAPAVLIGTDSTLYDIFLIDGNIRFESGNAGKGGNGGDGGDGYRGSNGKDAYKGSWFFGAGWYYGTSGNDGGNGGRGGNGGYTGHAGYMYAYTYRKLEGCNGFMIFDNGEYANGGDAGSGGNGGRGGDGGSCDGVVTGSGCTHGGSGGDGGDGGAPGYPGCGINWGADGEFGTPGDGGIHRRTLKNCSCRSDGDPGGLGWYNFSPGRLNVQNHTYSVTKFPIDFNPPAYIPGLSSKTVYFGGIAGHFEGGSIINTAAVVNETEYSLESKDKINNYQYGIAGQVSSANVKNTLAARRNYSEDGKLLGYTYVDRSEAFNGEIEFYSDNIELLNSESRDSSGILYSVRRDPFNPSKLVDCEVAVGLNSQDSRDSEGRYTENPGNEVNTSGFTGLDVVIPDYVFSGNFLNKVTEISRYAFYKSDIRTVKIGKNVEYIYDASFRECDRLEGVFVDEENPVYKNIADGSDPVDMYVGSVLYKTMVEGDFTVNGKLAELSADIVILAPKNANYSMYALPESVYGVNDYAFAEIIDLTTVDLSGIKVIGKNAFMSTGLKSVTGVSERGSISIGDYAFMGCYDLDSFSKDIVISEIGTQGFYGSAFTEFEIGKEATSIGSEAFGACSYLGSISVHEENKNYCNINSDGVLYSINGREMTLLQYPVNREDQSYTLPAGVTELAVGSFKGAKNLRSVSLGADLERICGEAFFGCRKLTSVYLGANVQWINNSGLSENPYASSVFTDCPLLKDIIVENSNKRFFDDEGVLYERINGEYYLICYPAARSALSYKILEGTVVLGASSIYRNTALVQLHIPASVREIDLDAISYNSELLGIYFYSAAMSIHSKAIANNNSSMFLYYPESEIDSWRGRYGNNLNFSSYGKINAVIDTSVSNSKNPYILAVYDIDGNPLGSDIYLSIKAVDSKGSESFIEQTVYNGYVLLDINIDNEEYTYTVSVTDSKEKYKSVYIPDMELDTEVRMSVITLAKTPVVNGLYVDAYGNDGETDLHRGKNILTDKETVNLSVYNEGLKLKLNISKNDVQETREYLIMKNGSVYKRYFKDENGVWTDENGLEVGYSEGHADYSANPEFKYLKEEIDGKEVTYGIAPRDAELRESADGTLTLILPAGDFKEGDVLSVQAAVVYGSNREVSQFTELNLKLIDFDESLIRLLLDDIQWDFADNLIAFLDDSELSIGGDKDIAKKLLMDNLVKKISIDIDISVEGDKLTISFGGNGSKDQKKDFGSKAHYRPGKGFVHGTHGETSKSKSFSVMGDVVFKYYDGKLHLVECGVAGTLSIEHSVQLGCFVVWVIPVVLEAEVGVSGQLKIDVLFDQEGGVPVFDNVRTGITVEGSVAFRAGIGCFVASVGAYGKVELSLHFEVLIPDGDGELLLTLSAEAGIYAKVNIGFFKVKFEKALVSFTASVGGKWDSEGWHWVAEAEGEIAKFADAAAYAIAVGNDESIYTDAYDPETVTYEKDGEINYVSFYVANVLPLCEKTEEGYSYNGVVYDELNYAKIVYSKYDSVTGAWEKPVILDNNGYVDGEFSVAVSDNTVYIAYTQMNSKMDGEMAADESKREALSTFEMKLGVIDGEELLWQETLTADTVYDSAPSLYVQNGLPTVYWARIPSGSLFGLTDSCDNSIYRADFDTAEAGVAKSGVPSIVAISATRDGFAVITDSDGAIVLYGEDGSQTMSTSNRTISFYDVEGNLICESEEGEYSSFGSMNGEPTVLVSGNLVDARELCKKNDVVVIPATTVGLTESYKAVYDENGRLDGIFFLSVAPGDKDRNNLYVIFNTENGFNSPIALTNNPEGVYIDAFSCAYVSEGKYLVGILDTNGERVSVCTVDDGFDVGEVTLKEIYEDGGIGISFTISNTGITPIEKADIELYDLSGYLVDVIYDYELPQPIYSGMTSRVEMILENGEVEASALRDGVDRELVVKAKNWEGSSKFRSGYVDLSVSGKIALIGKTEYVLLYVKNKGNVKAVAPKIGVASSEYVYCNGTDYPYVTTSPFYATDYKLEAGECAYVTVKADEELFASVFNDTERATGDISITVTCRGDDFNTTDNTIAENISIYRSEELVFDKSAPEDISVHIGTGSGVYVTCLEVMGGEKLEGYTLSEDGSLTVSAKALMGVADGKYTLICTLSDGSVINIPVNIINYY